MDGCSDSGQADFVFHRDGVSSPPHNHHERKREIEDAQGQRASGSSLQANVESDAQFGDTIGDTILSSKRQKSYHRCCFSPGFSRNDLVDIEEVVGSSPISSTFKSL